jgi:hypothetical protein
VILGLTGELADQVDPDRMDAIIARRGESQDESTRPAIPNISSIRRTTLSSTRNTRLPAMPTA